MDAGCVLVIDSFTDPLCPAPTTTTELPASPTVNVESSSGGSNSSALIAVVVVAMIMTLVIICAFVIYQKKFASKKFNLRYVGKEKVASVIAWWPH